MHLQNTSPILLLRVPLAPPAALRLPPRHVPMPRQLRDKPRKLRILLLLGPQVLGDGHPLRAIQRGNGPRQQRRQLSGDMLACLELIHIVREGGAHLGDDSRGKVEIRRVKPAAVLEGDMGVNRVLPRFPVVFRSEIRHAAVEERVAPLHSAVALRIREVVKLGVRVKNALLGVSDIECEAGRREKAE